MRLLYKAFIQKQLKTISLLIILSFLVLIAIQVTTTVWVKNLTLIERVNQVNGAHSFIYTFSDERADFFRGLIRTYADRNGLEIDVKKSYAFPYTSGKSSHDIFVMGHIIGDSNQYEVIEGKSLSELVGYEVAISESYARQLIDEGTDPIGHIIVYENILPYPVEFEVVSVIDFVNFNDAYVSDKGLKDIPLFDYPFVSVALGNYNTIQQLAKEPSSYGKVVLQARFMDYSRLAESNLVKFILDTHAFDSTSEQILPLYEITDYLSTNEQLYKHLSLIGLLSFMVATAYSFLTYIKRQLIQNSKNIGLLSIVGVSDKNIIKVFLVRLGIIFVIATLLLVFVNSGVYIWFKNDRSLANVFDINRSILLLTVFGAILYFLLIYGIYYIQIQKTIATSLSSVKTKQRHYVQNLISNKPWMPVVVAFKSIFAHIGFFGSTVIITSVLLFTLITNCFVYFQMARIHNEDTLGLEFDYLVTNAEFDDFAMTESYAKAQTMLSKTSGLYFIEINYSEYIRTYYKSNALEFYSDMAPFVSVVEGSAPPDLSPTFLENRHAYRFTAASRKHMDMTDGYVYTDENLAKYKNPERGYLFYTMPHSFGLSMSHETAATISGTVNTLIDNGWITFVYRYRQMIDIGVPFMEMYILQVDEGVSSDEIEQAMDERQMTYISKDDVNHLLNQANIENQREIFYFIVFISGLLLFVLIMNVYAYGFINHMENQEDDKLLKQVGIMPKVHRKIRTNQYLMFTLTVLMMIQLLLWFVYPSIFDGVLKAYGLYFTIPLPSLMQNSTLLMMLGITGAAIVLNLPFKKSN